ncbi:M23 family metallopeptidase [Porphyrobacter sp. LM 6]|jgi:murein DD-endopeptidase MepM/ murein hydrolase activator NlpD|uniref:M23 family metallopeptidase n=1 Tax=Porphyrobacter sp. LM 6 TaxID=1896196 RepID=UPI0008472C14|nr:M23 family metallopeptidase [Porphyrobacter sp. LM 6]AOL93341.1 Murein DD-endopeptidase MepM, murein hydrolase activator NlpD [Porphyrobacter sp. LM 6]
MKSVVRHVIKLAASAAAAILVSAASPALANTANSASSADIVEPVRDAQGDAAANSDQRFKSLFSSWTALERTSPTLGAGTDITTAYSSPIPQRGISVPSRMPLEGAALTSGFGMRDHPVLGGRRQHQGIDLAAPTGTPVYATADGVVGRADWYSSYGLYISINHGASMETRYAHLSRLAVAAGDNIKKGDLIGYVGSTGRSTGPHLHYEVRVEGLAVNPIPYMVESEAQLAYARDARLDGQGGE